jgi:hypothetical protein
LRGSFPQLERKDVVDGFGLEEDEPDTEGEEIDFPVTFCGFDGAERVLRICFGEVGCDVLAALRRWYVGKDAVVCVLDEGESEDATLLLYVLGVLFCV